MNILVVDDERRFPKLELDNDVTYAHTCAEAYVQLAFRELDKEPFDEIWLDHDLGNDGTIRPFVDFLEMKAILKATVYCDRIVAHSMNPVGRRYIMLALGDTYPVREEKVEDWL